MNEFDQVLQIQLADGRTLIARPRPEDQDFLSQIGDEAKLELGSTEYDTEGHAPTADLTIDVEGHAMTLRLPTPADAEALRRLLMAGALTATVVAAGAIAQLGYTPAPASTVVRPHPGPAAAQDFATRREVARDQLLEGAPAIAGEPSDIQFERLDRISTPSSVAQPARPDFQTRREQERDRLLESPGGAAPGTAAEDPDADQGGSHRLGGPQD